MKSSRIDLTFIKFVQDGSQNNSQCCINKRAWTSANKIRITMIKKMMPSWLESSLLMKHGSTSTRRSVNGTLWNGNIHNRPSRKVQKPTISRKIYAYRFLGLTRPNTWTLSGEGFNNKQCSLQWVAYSQAEAWNSKQMLKTNVEKHCVISWQCPSPHSWNAPETQVWGIGLPSV